MDNPELGDGFQMPGVFVLYKGEIRRSFIHRYPYDRPDYKEVPDLGHDVDILHWINTQKINMTNYPLILLLCFLSLALNAQTPERYSSVQISLVGKNMADLVGTGIETDHGQYSPGRSITTVLSTKEIERVQNAGFHTEILIADLSQYYLEQRHHPASVEARGAIAIRQQPCILIRRPSTTVTAPWAATSRTIR